MAVDCPQHPLETRPHSSCLMFSLGGRLRNTECRPVIDSGLDAFNHLRWKTSMLILAHATRLLEEGLPSPAIDEDYFKSAWKLFQTKGKLLVDEDTVESMKVTFYQQWTNDDKVDATGLCGMLEDNVQLMLKDYDNHNLQEVIRDHMILYVTARYRILKSIARMSKVEERENEKKRERPDPGDEM